MLTGQVTLLFYYVLGVRLGHERYLRVNAVGYSAVLFGWCGLTWALGQSGARGAGAGGAQGDDRWLCQQNDLCGSASIR